PEERALSGRADMLLCNIDTVCEINYKFFRKTGEYLTYPVISNLLNKW
ncbi:hypothetical protein MBD78_004361, partial [Escherichia coli]|nr:hypothetical protein [Escherichia coli]